MYALQSNRSTTCCKRTTRVETDCGYNLQLNTHSQIILKSIPTRYCHLSSSFKTPFHSDGLNRLCGQRLLLSTMCHIASLKMESTSVGRQLADNAKRFAESLHHFVLTISPLSLRVLRSFIFLFHIVLYKHSNHIEIKLYSFFYLFKTGEMT